MTEMEYPALVQGFAEKTVYETANLMYSENFPYISADFQDGHVRFDDDMN
jgi:hypothetical protein